LCDWGGAISLLVGILLVLLGADPIVPANGLGSTSFSAGYGNRIGRDTPDGSLALRGALMVDLTRSFGLGMEAGVYLIEQESPELLYEYPLSKSVFHFGALAQYLFGTAPIRPYLQIGAGHYRWNTNFLGASVGGGVRYQPGDFGYFGFIEGRWHDNIQRLGLPSPGFYTISAGAGVSW